MKSLEQELRDGNYDINDVLNDGTSERRVFLARMGRDVEALAGTLESDVYLGEHVTDILDLLIGPSGRGCSYSDMCEMVGDLKLAYHKRNAVTRNTHI